MVTSVISDTLRLVGSPVKSQRKVAQKDRWLYCKRLLNWVVCPMIVLRESRLCGKMESWDRITQSSSRRPRCVTQELGKRRVHRRNPKFEERTQNEILRQEWCARRDVWELAKDVYNLKKESKDTFYSPAEAWVMPAPSSTKPEERHS